jgi:hypothetical protein
MKRRRFRGRNDLQRTTNCQLLGVKNLVKAPELQYITNHRLHGKMRHSERIVLHIFYLLLSKVINTFEKYKTKKFLPL